MSVDRTWLARWMACGTVVLMASVTRADGNAPDVQLEGAGDACVGAAVLRARVAHYLAAVALQRELSVRVHYAHEGAEFTLLRGEDAVARRRFAGLPEACADRRDTLAIAIAVAIEQTMGALAVTGPGREAAGLGRSGSANEYYGDAHAHGDVQEDEDVHVHEDEAHAQQEVDAPVDEEVKQEELQPVAAGHVDAPPASEAGAPGSVNTRRDRVRVAAGARLITQMLPETALVFGAGLDVPVAGPISVQVSGLASLEQSSAIASATVRTSALGGEALGCGQLIAGVIGARLCAGAAAASIAADGDQFYQNLSTRRAWVAALARAAVRWPVEAPVALQAALGLHANLVRPQLEVVDSNDALALTGVVGGSFELDVLVGLP